MPNGLLALLEARYFSGEQIALMFRQMTLTNLTKFPKGGYRFKQPELDWEVPRETALISLEDVVRAVQMIRAQNPSAGLDPSYEACLADVKSYTCKRLGYDPQFCGPQVQQPSTRRAGCASCR